MQRKMAAQQLINQSVSQTGAEAIRAENERLKAEIEQTKLKSEQQTPPQADQWQAYLLSQMEKLQGALGDTQKALSEQQIGALEERMALLAAELERTRTERPEAVNPVTTAKQSIQDARELLELLAPTQTPPPPVSGDAHLQAWTMKAQLEQKRWELDREDKHAETMARLELERDTKRAELDLKDQHYQRMDRFFSETAPKLLEVGQRLLDGLMQRPAATAGTAAPTVAAQVQAPAGYESGTCVQCQNPIFYKPEWGEVVCQKCGAVYSLTPDEPATENSTDRYHRPTNGAGPKRQAVSQDEDEGARL